jgi:hypothetical protein
VRTPFVCEENRKRQDSWLHLDSGSLREPALGVTRQHRPDVIPSEVEGQPQSRTAVRRNDHDELTPRQRSGNLRLL